MKRFVSPILVALFILLMGCNQGNKQVSPDYDFGKYVQAYTSGTISTEAVVTIYLAQPLQNVSLSWKRLFKFSPEIKGKTTLIDERIIEFRPDEPLKPGTTYTGKFFLKEVVETEPKFETMPFQFSTIQQSFSVSMEGLSNYESGPFDQMQYTGYLITADVANLKETEQVLSATYQGKNIAVHWSHDTDRRKHFFSVDSLVRLPEKSAELVLKWNGKPLDVDKKGEEKVAVPALNVFEVLESKVVRDPEQHIQIRFSDPLIKTQDLNGLITLQNGKELRLSIEGNMVKAWPAETLSGEMDLTVSEGIKNVNNVKLKKTETFRLQFSRLLPEIRLVGKGVIVPQSTKLELAFEAVSLNAVELRVIQIFKDNVFQFFQDNQWTGDSDLKKVGRLVYSGKADLKPTQAGGLDKWNLYKVNLSNLFQIEQGAIYHVELRMKREFSLVDCGEDAAKSNLKEAAVSTKEDYQTEWDTPGWYSSYYYPDDFDWQQRDNPCHVSYYNYGRFVSQNIFASELGIIAKEGRNHQMLFAVSNLISTKAESGVELKLYNYQNQLIETIITDKDGMARVDLRKKPFFLFAKKGQQFGYLRLDDGSSLSTSNFNVSGEEVIEGIKGFIYGERGVWRPGDTLFLNFILEKEGPGLPDDYPVIFQLTNPSGQVVEKTVRTASLNGFYSFQTKTASDAPTGNWRAEVNVGNATFSKRIKIETVKPNRLKVELGLPKTVITKNTKEIPLEASWLHGSPARSMKTKVDVLFVEDKTQFEGFAKYSFNDPASSFSPMEQTVFEGKLDENGKTKIPIDFKAVQNAPGMLKAWFTSRVFEEGGDFSINVAQAKYAPFNTFVGVKMPESADNWYKTDTNYKPEIVLLDANGKPTSGDKLQVKLYKIDWRWWWEAGSEHLAHYVSGRHYRPIETWNINKADHKNTVDLNVKHRNWQDNGRYLLWVKDETSGHSSGVTFYMSEWGSWRSDGMAEGATLLALRTDKEKYTVGEKIEVTLPSSKGGKALVSLENGTEVTDLFWVETTEKQTRFTIDVKPEMAPNFYVHVSLVQPYGQAENDAPLRLYGITPVLVENPATVLTPVIETKAEIEPETKYTVKVSEANKKEITYTLAIVDEGLLGLTSFKTPDPHSAFYAREALGVKTWDLYDYVAGAYGAKLEKAFAVGGDEDLANAGKKEANRFKPVVQFAGPFTLKKGGINNHEFTMPNYVGAVRIMVIAGKNGAYGNADKTVPVRKSLMLLATLPRVLAPNEELRLPVNVFAMKENVKNVSINVKTNDLVEVMGETNKSTSFSATGEKMVYFNLKARKNTGIAKIIIEAKSGNERASYEVELEIRNPNSPITVEQSAMVDGQKSWSANLKLPGEIGTNKAWVEISGFPPLDLAKRLNYLIQYPHNCLEQIVSAAFPQLYLSKLTELTSDQKMETEDNVRAALQKLQLYQLPNGGFAYWPGASRIDDWSTNYAGHFMLKAESAGYSLPVGLKNKWLNFQKTEARNWRSSDSYRNGVYFRNLDFVQAYRLYTLALAGSPDLGAMNRMLEKSEKSTDVAWRLAAAYMLAGQPEAARKLVANLTTEVEKYNEFDGTFGSGLRDKSMILETLVLLDDKAAAFKMLKNISEEMNRSSWLSTQTAAWCLSSAAMYAEKYYKGDAETRFTLTVNGKKTNLRTTIPVVTIPVEINKEENIQVDYKNEGANSSFISVLARGIPVGVDSTSVSNNLLMNVEYLNSANEKTDPTKIVQGEDFKMVVTVKNPGMSTDYKNMVLNTVFPSGWEIMNRRLNDVPQNGDANFSYQNIRDDRIYTYFDLGMNQIKTFEFRLNASYLGSFYQPPVSCEAMYENSVRAQKPGQWVKVVDVK